MSRFPCLEVDNERELKLRIKLCFEKLVNDTLYQDEEAKMLQNTNRKLRESQNILASSLSGRKVSNPENMKFDTFRKSS